MSSSSHIRRKSRHSSHSDEHSNVTEHHKAKNEPHNKSMNIPRKHSIDHTIIRGTKNLNTHVREVSPTKNASSATTDHGQKSTKCHVITPLHGVCSNVKPFVRSTSDDKKSASYPVNIRNISKKPDVHQQQIDKDEKTDHAVLISISVASEENSPETIDIDDQDQVVDS